MPYLLNEENNIHLQILMTTLQYTYSRHTVKFKTVARLGKQQLPGQAFLSHKGVQKGPKLIIASLLLLTTYVLCIR